MRHRTRASAGGEQTWKEFMAISSAVSHCGGPRLFGTLIRAPRPAAGESPERGLRPQPPFSLHLIASRI